MTHWARGRGQWAGRKGAGFGNPYTPEVGVTGTFNYFKHSSVPKGVELRSQGHLIISDYPEYRIGPERDRSLKNRQPKPTA